MGRLPERHSGCQLQRPSFFGMDWGSLEKRQIAGKDSRVVWFVLLSLGKGVDRVLLETLHRLA
jgi:hypothetical protein